MNINMIMFAKIASDPELPVKKEIRKSAKKPIVLKIRRIGTASRDLSRPMNAMLVLNIFQAFTSLSQKDACLPIPIYSKTPISTFYYIRVVPLLKYKIKSSCFGFFIAAARRHCSPAYEHY